MLTTSVFSLLYFFVAINTLGSSIYLLLKAPKPLVNRLYGALAVAVSLWTVGLGIAGLVASDTAGETWMRIAALGWGTLYAILLHFALVLTGYGPARRRNYLVGLLYLPAFLTVLANSFPLFLNPDAYLLTRTAYGLVNMAGRSFWDWFFYCYYLSYMTGILILLYRYQRELEDQNRQKRVKSLWRSIIFILVAGSGLDIVLHQFFPTLPYFAPLLMFHPLRYAFELLYQQGSVGEEHSLRRSNFLVIIISVFAYVAISFLQMYLRGDLDVFGLFMVNEASYRGVITQLQMVISILLVLKITAIGFFVGLILNALNLVSSVMFLVRTHTTSSIPGIISYLGVIFLLVLIKAFLDHERASRERIEEQRKCLEDSERKLYHMAYYDTLTSLPNRDLFFQEVAQHIDEAKKTGAMLGVLFIDFDSFKAINDTAGHATGDKVLQKIAHTLSSALQEQDFLARYGGDEFLIQLGPQPTIEGFSDRAHAILSQLRKPLSLGDNEYFLPASMGLAIYPLDGESIDELIRHADIAMYSAKTKGKNQLAFCTADMKDNTTQKMRLTNSLYRALDRGELFLQYQAQIASDTEEIVGFEALLRWKHDEYGIIPPLVFIPMAEQTGMIRPIGLWVIEQSCEQLKLFKQQTQRNLRLAINVSLLQLRDPSIARKIGKILIATETDPKDICIEITESVAFMDEPYILERLKELKALGMSLAIDDFGTGYSSLSRLKLFPIDVLKIDMEFVQGVGSEIQKETAILKSIIQMGKNLHFHVLAEGVETKEQVDYLKEHGCDEMQGYYYSRPVDGDAAIALLT